MVVTEVVAEVVLPGEGRGMPVAIVVAEVRRLLVLVEVDIAMVPAEVCLPGELLVASGVVTEVIPFSCARGATRPKNISEWPYWLGKDGAGAANTYSLDAIAVLKLCPVCESGLSAPDSHKPSVILEGLIDAAA